VLIVSARSIASSIPAAANHLLNPLRFIDFLLSFLCCAPALPVVFVRSQ
jgi:hypothetical protein